MTHDSREQWIEKAARGEAVGASPPGPIPGGAEPANADAELEQIRKENDMMASMADSVIEGFDLEAARARVRSRVEGKRLNVRLALTLTPVCLGAFWIVSWLNLPAEERGDSGWGTGFAIAVAAVSVTALWVWWARYRSRAERAIEGDPGSVGAWLRRDEDAQARESRLNAVCTVLVLIALGAMTIEAFVTGAPVRGTLAAVCAGVIGLSAARAMRSNA